MVDRNVCVRRSKSGSSFFVLVPWPRRLITLGRSEGSVFSVHLHLHYLLVSYHYLTICYFFVCVLPSCFKTRGFLSFRCCFIFGCLFYLALPLHGVSLPISLVSSSTIYCYFSHFKSAYEMLSLLIFLFLLPCLRCTSFRLMVIGTYPIYSTPLLSGSWLMW
jgi:hypothetical protein